ncbi:hypothetical protein BKA93DRAFT_387197 [Sparassis latifolia]
MTREMEGTTVDCLSSIYRVQTPSKKVQIQPSIDLQRRTHAQRHTHTCLRNATKHIKPVTSSKKKGTHLSPLSAKRPSSISSRGGMMPTRSGSFDTCHTALYTSVFSRSFDSVPTVPAESACASSSGTTTLSSSIDSLTLPPESMNVPCESGAPMFPMYGEAAPANCMSDMKVPVLGPEGSPEPALEPVA